MRRTGATIAAAILICATSGCGTMANLTGNKAISDPSDRKPENFGAEWMTMPFGGVAQDLQWSAQRTQSAAKHYWNRSIYLGGEDVVWAWVGLVDLPISLVGDLVTLPLATYRWVHPRQATLAGSVRDYASGTASGR